MVPTQNISYPVIVVLDSHSQRTHRLRLVPFDANVGHIESIYDHVKGRLPLDKVLEALQLLGEGETLGYQSFRFTYVVKCFMLPFEMFVHVKSILYLIFFKLNVSQLSGDL